MWGTDVSPLSKRLYASGSTCVQILVSVFAFCKDVTNQTILQRQTHFLVSMNLPLHTPFGSESSDGIFNGRKLALEHRDTLLSSELM